jgi:hypothetical protein
MYFEHRMKNYEGVKNKPRKDLSFPGESPHAMKETFLIGWKD